MHPLACSQGGMLQPKLCDFDAARVIAEEIAWLGGCTMRAVERGTSRFSLASLRGSISQGGT
eukprot:6457409-Amphidinium_carterae.2